MRLRKNVIILCSFFICVIVVLLIIGNKTESKVIAKVDECYMKKRLK